MKRILMLSKHPLFRQGLEALLCQRIDAEFVGRESDVERAVASIQLYQPDIVVVDHEYASCMQSPVILEILGAGLNIKLIGLNLQTNTLCIYHGEQRLAQNVQDLVRVIQEDSRESIAERGTEESSKLID